MIHEFIVYDHERKLHPLYRVVLVRVEERSLCDWLYPTDPILSVRMAEHTAQADIGRDVWFDVTHKLTDNVREQIVKKLNGGQHEQHT